MQAMQLAPTQMVVRTTTATNWFPQVGSWIAIKHIGSGDQLDFYWGFGSHADRGDGHRHCGWVYRDHCELVCLTCHDLPIAHALADRCANVIPLPGNSLDRISWTNLAR